MILTKDEFLEDRYFLRKIKKGAVFIYPTDTIYGIGCNALDDKAVSKIREIKKRDNKPFSIIAPNKDWILKNCKVKEKDLDKIPGPYTYVLETKIQPVSKKVNPDTNLLGVRIPKHWFSEISRKLKVPIVTTSVNISGKKHMNSLDNLEEEIKNKVDFIVYEGKKQNRPSTIIKIIGNSKEILARD